MPRTQLLGTTDSEGTIWLWDLRDKTVTREWGMNHALLRSLTAAAQPDSRTRLASTSMDQRLRIWDPANGQQLSSPMRLRIQMPTVVAVHVSGGDTVLAIHGHSPDVLLIHPDRVGIT